MTTPTPARRIAVGATSILLVLVVAAGALWAVSQRSYLADLWDAWQFTPSPAMAAIAERAALSDHGDLLLEASEPRIEAAEDFNASCGREDPTFYVLGCYTDGRIYLYRIDDERLDGVMEVTAAHEMLHAAWVRMSPAEQDRLEPLLEAEYARVADDAFAERMAYYAKAQPGTRNNELHSIIGTEVAHLSPELEEHYAEFFDDRSVVTGLYADYSGVLTELQENSQELVDQLDALSSHIEAMQADYSARLEVLDADVTAFNARADREGGFSSQTEFDRERQALLQRRAELDEMRQAINDDIDEYDRLYAELQELDAEFAGLMQSLDSLQAPPEPIQ